MAAESHPEEVRAALLASLADGDTRRTLRLEVECARDGRLPAVIVFGRGIGIWDGRRQFALPAETITYLVAALRDADFAGLPPSFGEGVENDAALRITCRIALRAAGANKQVVQFEKGEQSTRLRRLADAVYAVCEPLARSGTAADDLADGLDKVARGELEPESLSLLVHRKPELGDAGTTTGGFLLRLADGRASLQPFEVATGYGAPRERAVDRAELERLASVFAAHSPGRLPANVWARDYVDFELSVLDQRVAVQARRFTGMTKTTHGAAQRDFDAILAAVDELRRSFEESATR